MENFRLKVFRTVASKHSFRHAAEVLYLTQPAVTLQVKALEDEIGLKLFDRSAECGGIGDVDLQPGVEQAANRLHASAHADNTLPFTDILLGYRQSKSL